MQVEARNDFSVYQIKKYGMGANRIDLGDKLMMEKTDVTRPGLSQRPLPIDVRRDDHESHKKSATKTKSDQENDKITAEIEKINWLKNKSILDLSELM